MSTRGRLCEHPDFEQHQHATDALIACYQRQIDELKSEVQSTNRNAELRVRAVTDQLKSGEPVLPGDITRYTAKAVTGPEGDLDTGTAPDSPLYSPNNEVIAVRRKLQTTKRQLDNVKYQLMESREANRQLGDALEHQFNQVLALLNMSDATVDFAAALHQIVDSQLPAESPAELIPQLNTQVSELITSIETDQHPHCSNAAALLAATCLMVHNHTEGRGEVAA